MFRRNKHENKAKLEHKLYLARENPEPIFDLSECDLNNVPSGIYSLCRVFLKEVLKLDHNNLTSLAGGGQLKDLHLLKVLHLQNNSIKTLPDDISLLKSLIELNVSENKIKTLPESIGNLVHLEILDVSNNILKTLPTLDNLIKLKQLNIRGNPGIQHLPKSICKAQRLVALDVDVDNLIYPPKFVAEMGLKSIMCYICDDVGCSYAPPELVEESEEVDGVRCAFENDNFNAKIWELEKIKQQRVQDFLEMEKYNETVQKREFELANSQKLDREKLLAAIVEDQKQFDSKLNRIQIEKETERFKLIEQLQEAEQNADLAVNQLLALSQKPMEQLLQQEKLEEERLLSAVNRSYNETLRKDDILNAMKEILTQETKKFNQYNRHREENFKSMLEHGLELDTKLMSVLQDQDQHKCELIAKLQEDSELQKALVGTLLERSDARSWSLMQQVRLVESQLGALTQIEIERRKLEVDQHLNDLCQKRTDLSYLLMDLLVQQRERRNQLLSTLQSLEDANENVDDFWLRQYQRLLDKMPDSLLSAQMNIDPKLSQALLMNGAIHCLPFLAKVTQSICDIRCINENDLIECGIHDCTDRIHILDAFQVYAKMHVDVDEVIVPSAPELPMEEQASAPPLLPHIVSQTECVICMDSDCAVIFVPCGHLCCCSKCSMQVVEQCPMCRSIIEHKISLSC